MDKLQLLPSKWTKYCSAPRILVLNEGTSTSAWRCLLSGEYCYDSLSQIWFPLRSRRGWEKKKDMAGFVQKSDGMGSSLFYVPAEETSF